MQIEIAYSNIKTINLCVWACGHIHNYNDIYINYTNNSHLDIYDRCRRTCQQLGPVSWPSPATAY